MFCQKCGASMQDDDTFCGKCGHQVKDGSPSGSPSTLNTGTTAVGQRMSDYKASVIVAAYFVFIGIVCLYTTSGPTGPITKSLVARIFILYVIFYSFGSLLAFISSRRYENQRHLLKRYWSFWNLIWIVVLFLLIFVGPTSVSSIAVLGIVGVVKGGITLKKVFLGPWDK